MYCNNINLSAGNLKLSFVLVYSLKLQLVKCLPRLLSSQVYQVRRSALLLFYLLIIILKVGIYEIFSGNWCHL